MVANAVLQRDINGSINPQEVGSSALLPSFGGVLISRVGLQGIINGVVSGIISGPSTVFGNAFFGRHDTMRE